MRGGGPDPTFIIRRKCHSYRIFFFQTGERTVNICNCTIRTFLNVILIIVILLALFFYWYIQQGNHFRSYKVKRK